MCSIFTVISKNNYVDKDKCRSSQKISQTRGPDLAYYYTNKNLYIGCNVLSINGTPDSTYYKHSNLFLAYNGEIYNSHKNTLPDTNYVLTQFIEKESNYKDVLYELDGMFGIVLYNNNTDEVVIARDVQGEKTLYVYEDSELFIISSTLACIEAYLNELVLDPKLQHFYLHTRHFLTYNRTIYKNIRQVSPGSYIIYNTKTHTHKTFFYKKLIDAYCENTLYINNSKTQAELVEELDYLLDKNIKQMMPDRKYSVSFSGGIDSSLIAAYINKYSSDFLPIAINCVGKDYITPDLTPFNQYITPRITTLNITEKEWYGSLWKTYEILRMPLPSHNYCTKKILAEYLNKNNIKVCFGGEGADELFGGYNFYNHICNDSKNISPYSSFIEQNHITNNKFTDVLSRYLNSVWQYYYKITNDTVVATSLTDTFMVVADDGLRNNDQICGYYGIEGRSPFMRWDIIKFAINLPPQYKRGKILLRDLFSKYYPGITIKEKQGFAGFPCESYKYFYKKKTDFDVIPQLDVNSFAETPAMFWKLLNLQYFYECYSSRYIFNHS